MATMTTRFALRITRRDGETRTVAEFPTLEAGTRDYTMRLFTTRDRDVAAMELVDLTTGRVVQRGAQP